MARKVIANNFRKLSGSWCFDCLICHDVVMAHGIGEHLAGGHGLAGVIYDLDARCYFVDELTELIQSVASKGIPPDGFLWIVECADSERGPWIAASFHQRECCAKEQASRWEAAMPDQPVRVRRYAREEK